MNPVDFLSVDLCVLVVQTLAHFLWQGCVIFSFVVAANRLMGRSPAARYFLGCAALLLMVTCLPVTFAVLQHQQPAAQTEILVMQPADATPAVAQRNEQGVLERPNQNPGRTSTSHDQRVPTETALVVQPPGNRVLPRPSPISNFWQRNSQVVAGLYVVGVVLMFLRLGLALVAAQRLRGCSELVEDAAILKMAKSQATSLGLHVAPSIAQCRRIAVPIIAGVIKPTILLPLCILSELSPTQIEAVLAHELAHIRRWDHVANLVQRIIESLLFFHPAVWYVSRCVSRDRENCCDDMAIDQGIDVAMYAELLVRVSELSQAQGAPSGATLAATGQKPSRLHRRITRLLGQTKDAPIQVSRGGLALAGMTVLAVAFASVYLRVHAASQQETDSNEFVSAHVFYRAENGEHYRKIELGSTGSTFKTLASYFPAIGQSKRGDDEARWSTPLVIEFSRQDDSRHRVTCDLNQFWNEGTGDHPLHRPDRLRQFLEETYSSNRDTTWVQFVGDGWVELQAVCQARSGDNRWRSPEGVDCDFKPDLGERHAPAGTSIMSIRDLAGPGKRKFEVLGAEVVAVDRREQSALITLKPADDQTTTTLRVGVERGSRFQFIEFTGIRLQPDQIETQHLRRRDEQVAVDQLDPSTVESIRQRYRDPDLRLAVMYDSERNGGVRLEQAQTKAEQYYLAYLPRAKNSAERCFIYSQLSVLLSTNWHQEQGERPDYPKSRRYARMAIQAEPHRIGKSTIRARARLANGPDMYDSELFHGRLKFYNWLSSFDEKSARANWLPLDYQVGREDRYFPSFMKFVENVKKAESHNLTWTDPRDQQPHNRLLCVMESAPGTPAARVAQAKLNHLWGQAVDGLQSMLVVKQVVWPVGKVPELTARIRNRGETEFQVAQAQQLCEIEVDGRWYRWIGDFRIKSSWLSPNRTYKGITFTLNKNWHDKETGQPLTLSAGRHTVRVAFLPTQGDAGRGRPVTIRVLSNPIRLDIIPIAWGKPNDGVRVGTAIWPSSVGAEQAPNCWWSIQNVSDQRRAVWLGEEDLVSIGRNGEERLTYARGFRAIHGVMLQPSRRLLKPGELYVTSVPLFLLKTNTNNRRVPMPLQNPGRYQINAVYDPYDPVALFGGPEIASKYPDVNFHRIESAVVELTVRNNDNSLPKPANTELPKPPKGLSKIPKVKLRGRVLDQPGGTGIGGVKVVVQTGLGYGIFPSTDKDGRYTAEMEASQEKRFPTLWIDRAPLPAGESIAQRVNVTVTNDDVQVPDLYLQVPTSISGRVTDADTGQPIAMAMINESTLGGSVATNKDGRFRIYFAGSGKTTVQCTGTGDSQYDCVSDPQQVTVDTDHSPADLNFRLRRRPSFQFEVLMPDGSPAQDARAWVQIHWHQDRPEVRLNSLNSGVALDPPVTHVRGNRFQAILPLPEVEVRDRYSGFAIHVFACLPDGSFSALAKTEQTKLGESPRLLQIKLDKSAAAAVVLKDSQGRPVSSAKLIGSYSTGDSWRNLESLDRPIDLRALGDGRFRLEGIVPGVQYHPLLQCGGKYAQAKQFTAVPGKEYDLGTLTVDWWEGNSPRDLARRLQNRTSQRWDRVRAAQTLGEFGPDAATAVPALIDALKNDPNHDVSADAARALAKIGHAAKPALPHLINALREGHPSVREAAAFALGEIGDQSALPALRAALADPVPDVQMFAQTAISRIEDPTDARQSPRTKRSQEAPASKNPASKNPARKNPARDRLQRWSAAYAREIQAQLDSEEQRFEGG